MLSGWLHRTARNIAAQTIRTEVRRRTREKEAAAMNESPVTDAVWENIAPHLDAALAELGESDRDAVLLRYFENKPAQEMAAVLGISAEAAQKRVSRAVEKLRENIAKRGITAGAAGLTGIISANAVQVAPLGLATTISSAASVGTVSIAAGTLQFLTMTLLKKALVAAAVFVIGGTLIYEVRSRSQTSAPPLATLPPVSSQKPQPRDGGSVVEQIAKARDIKPTIDRKKELERLKAMWMEFDEDSAIITEEHEKLAIETARVLLCGREALELVVFLKSNRRKGHADVVRGGVSAYLATIDDPEARKLLIEAAAENREEMKAQRYDPLAWKSAASERNSLLVAWSKAAGRSCSLETLEELRGGLKDEKFGQEALYGYYLERMQTDPEGALRGTLEALKSGVHSPSQGQSICMLFREKLPDDVNFVQLEQLLPKGDGRENESSGNWVALEWGRHELFSKWAERDPAGAANHVMANPDRLNAKLIGLIVSSYYYKDPTGTATWVSQFPAGPYYDLAASSAVIHTRSTSPVETEELILKIGDPKLREEALRILKAPSTNPDTR